MLFGEQNVSAFDWWSLVHFMTGYIAAKTQLFSLFTFFIAHGIFEIWENSEHGIKTFQRAGSEKYSGDSPYNFIGDTLMAMTGFYVGNMR